MTRVRTGLAVLSLAAASLLACSSPGKIECLASTMCGSACVDLATSHDNCGACGAPCAPTELCQAGGCVAACAAPLATCASGSGAYCADLRYDVRNCGTCGTVCSGFCAQSYCISYIVGRTWPLNGGNASFGPNYLLGTQIALPAGKVFALTDVVQAVDAGKHVKMALYTDASGSPGTLVTQTASSTLVSGLNVLPVTTATITAGNYWIMAVYDATVLGYKDVDSVTIKYVSLSYTSPLPATFPTPITYTGSSFAYAVAFSP